MRGPGFRPAPRRKCWRSRPHLYVTRRISERTRTRARGRARAGAAARSPVARLDVECLLDHRLGCLRDLLVAGCVGVVAVVGEVVCFVVGVVGSLEGGAEVDVGRAALARRRLFDGTATDHHGVERPVRAYPRRHRLRLDRRQPGRQPVLRRGESETRRTEGPPPQQGRQTAPTTLHMTPRPHARPAANARA